MITIETKDFLRGMNAATLATARRTTVPVLGCLRLKPGAAGELIVSGTDLDMQVDATVPADLNGSGEFETVLTAPKMLGLAAKRAGGLMVGIDPSKDAGNVAVNCGRFDYTWGTMVADDWPDMDVPRTELRTATFGAEFIDALRRVRPCMSEEETRYYLNGVHVHAAQNGRGCVMVATDGHRLTAIDLPMPAATGALPGVIIPRQAVGAILTLAKANPSEPVHFRVSTKAPRNSEEPNAAKLVGGDPHLVEIRIGAFRIISKLIDGTYPDYRRLLPAAAGVTATFNRAELQRAVDALRFANNRSRARYGYTAIRFDLLKGSAALSASNAGEGVSSRTSVLYEGDATGCTLGLNSKYLGDMLAAYEPSEMVTLAFTSAADAGRDPVAFTAPDDSTTMSLLMPMRV
jgi:DNA polymerase-3 subunit beta